jgi:hypothetical protein
VEDLCSAIYQLGRLKVKNVGREASESRLCFVNVNFLLNVQKLPIVQYVVKYYYGGLATNLATHLIIVPKVKLNIKEGSLAKTSIAPELRSGLDPDPHHMNTDPRYGITYTLSRHTVKVSE